MCSSDLPREQRLEVSDAVLLHEAGDVAALQQLPGRAPDHAHGGRLGESPAAVPGMRRGGRGTSAVPDLRRRSDSVASMSSTTDNDLLAWIDLEMTGLDVDRDVIVEIACLVTNSALEIVDDGIDVVVNQPAALLAGMEDVVRNMHTKSGLLPAIEASTVDLSTAGGMVLDYLRSHLQQGRAPLCGNTIGMDRRFLARYLPEIDGFLHYRSIDVSSFKELCRRWYPDAYRARPGKKESHRALDDIRESVAELRHYRDTIFRPLTPPA